MRTGFGLAHHLVCAVDSRLGAFSSKNVLSHEKSECLEALLVALSNPAVLGADLPSKREAVVSPVAVLTWTTFHVSFNAGVTWVNSSSPSTTGCPNYARSEPSLTTVSVVAGMATGLTGGQSLDSASSLSMAHN